MPEHHPLVSVVTPLYNCEAYLQECIESIIRQTYENWEYIIVDNCSTDASFEIAQGYAARDPRIRVVKCTEFLPVIANFNRTVREISDQSKYCKFVFSDDWLYPTCIEDMVRLAEEHPSIGLVGAYGTDGKNVLWTGVRGKEYEIYPPDATDFVSGRDACRNRLLGRPYVFGSCGSVMYRSDLIRKRPMFFNEDNRIADLEACFEVLSESDFGFIHKILTFSRYREESETSFSASYNSFILGEFVVFLRFGPVFLTHEEYQERLEVVSSEYYATLGQNVLRLRPKDYWEYHKEALKGFGFRLEYSKLLRAALVVLWKYLRQPWRAPEKIYQWWPLAVKRLGHWS